MNFTPAKEKTMYFIGVTTEKSSIMRVFPQWAAALGLTDTVIKGIDIAIHEKNEVYREVVSFIKNDPLSLGALVTTHKIDLYNAAKDLFEYLDPYASTLGEISSISKKNGQLCGHAKDPISSGLSLEEFVPQNYWRDFGGDVMIMGAGGSAISMGAYFMSERFAGNYPRRIIITNRSQPRLDQIRDIFHKMDPGGIEFQYHLCPEMADNDRVLECLSPRSLVVNATGLGKDRPGSPLSDQGQFPQDSLVWEINYRGELNFMHQALHQKQEKNLHVEDGWKYFIYGWTQVISEVFHIPIEGDTFACLDSIAKNFR